MTMAVTLKDLKDKHSYSNVLYCSSCGSECSADPRDYYDMNDADTFNCAHSYCHDNELQLVRKEVRYIPV